MQLKLSEHCRNGWVDTRRPCVRLGVHVSPAEARKQPPDIPTTVRNHVDPIVVEAMALMLSLVQWEGSWWFLDGASLTSGK